MKKDRIENKEVRDTREKKDFKGKRKVVVGAKDEKGNRIEPVEVGAEDGAISVGVRKAQVSELVEKVISINRVTKVNKGGKKLSFSALVIVGDGHGRVGYNLGKANEVPAAIKKAILGAKRNILEINLKGSTITHEIIGVCGSAEVLLKPASEGTGVIACGPVRSICDAAGIRNLLSKCHRSNNPINVVKATIDGLSRLKPERILPEENKQ